jgi:anti-sigma factor RsiW
MSEIRHDLKAYLDGELSEERASEVMAALASDPELRQEADFMNRLTQSFQSLSQGPAPVGAEKALPRRNRRWVLPLAAAAASVFVVAVISSRLLPSVERSRAAGESATLSKAPADAAGAEYGRAPLKEEVVAPNSPEPARPPASALDYSRAVVRTATLTVKVQDAEQDEARVTALTKGWGGYVESSESSRLESDRPVITMTLRIPEKRFDDALSAFEKLGVRSAKTVTGQDVTSQLVDMDARLRNLRVQEETYRMILKQARKMGEVLEVQQRLSEIRGEIESMAAQAKALRGLAALSTITLTLEQRPSGAQENGSDDSWTKDAWASATKALGSALQALATGGIWLFVYAPIWLPLAAAFWLVARKISGK